VAEIHQIDNDDVTTWNNDGTADEPKSGYKEIVVKTNAVTKKQYKIRVIGENSLGLGEWSEWSSLMLPPKGYALGVVNPINSLQRHTDLPERGKLKFQWFKYTDQQADLIGGDDALNIRYHVKSCRLPCANADVTSVDGGYDLMVNEFELSNLTVGDDYLIHVHAFNSNGVLSDAVSIEATVGAFPEAPPLTSVVVTGGDLTNPTQTWYVPMDNGGSPIVAFEISRSTNENEWITVDPHLTSYQWQSVPTEETSFYVRARTKVGLGPHATSPLVDLRPQ